MKLPKTVTIGPFVYRVKRPTNIVSESGETMLGQCRNARLVILVTKDAPGPRQRESLLHEVVHAVSCERHLGLDEHVVDQLSSGLTQVLSENPKLTRLFLPEGEK